MANRTVKDAKTIHGTNPQYLVEKIIRTRIYESKFWKEDCFALNMELLVDKAVEMRYVGGVYGGNIKPSPFICLVLKMLQIQPEEEIVLEFIQQEHFKYLRALGAFYLRLTASSLTIWKVLEPIYTDYRQLRIMDRMGKFNVITMDEFVDQLLREDRVFDVILPRISKRQLHEETGDLKPKKWLLDSELNETGETDESEDEEPQKANHSPELNVREKSSRDLRNDHDDRRRERHRDSRDYRRDRSRERSRERRHRDRSRDRYDRRDRDGKDSDRRRPETKTEKEEIDEANQLRARLGLKPLRPSKSNDDKKKEGGRNEDRSQSSNNRKMTEQDEFDEANKLRASLGLKPLRR